MSEQQQVVTNGNEAKEKDLFKASLAEIRKLVPKGFEEKTNKSGITWFGENKTRLMKMVESKNGLRIEFNVEVPKVDGLLVLTESEAKEKHMGTCRWIYSGKNIDEVKKLVAVAVKGFAPKKRSDSKEEKDKKEAQNKPQDPVQQAASEKASGVTTRQLTKEELDKLNGNKTPEQKEKEKVKNIQNGNKK